MSADPSDNRLVIARISAPHGVKGWVKIKSFAQQAEDFCSYGPLTYENGQTVGEILIKGQAKEAFICQLTDCQDRTQAEKISGQTLYLDKNLLPPPEDENDFYHSDLIGLDVTYPNGTKMGQVKALHDFGAGDIVEIEEIADSKGKIKTSFWPFTKAVFPDILLEERRIVCRPPAEIYVDPQAEKDLPESDLEASDLGANDLEADQNV